MNTTGLLDIAEIAMAAYGQFNAIGTPRSEDLTTLNGDTRGFAQSQAVRFASRFTVGVPTFNDATSTGGSGRTSFDVTVFVGKIQNVNLEKVFISLRGTGQQLDAPQPNDILEVVEIGAQRAAADQIVAMYNWWQRVSTLGRTNLAQYQIVQLGLAEKAPPGAVYLPAPFLANPAGILVRDYLVRIADASSTGEVATLLAATPGSKVALSGSSLGGHLAMAFAGLFPQIVDSATAFNSPGFPTNSFVQGLFTGLGGSVPAVGNPLITNVVSREANNAGIQLNVIAGYPFGNYPGLSLTIPIEDQFFGDVPDPKPHSYNHDQRQVTDALTVYDMLQRLDGSLTLKSFDSLLRASAQGENRSLENLVDTVESFFGIDNVQMPAGNGNRNFLHGALQSIVGFAPQSPDPNSAFASLSGHANVYLSDASLGDAARTRFSALVALKDLAPIWIRSTDEAGDASLNALWIATRRADYEGWLADGPPSDFTAVTKNWINDRASMLGVLTERNTQNLATSRFLQGFNNTDYTDLTTEQAVSVRHGVPASGTGIRRVVFGKAGADDIAGAGVADGLYGGGGDDRLSGFAGNDHLEGNAGNDILVGGSGNDTLQGGVGADTYQFKDSFGNDTIFDADGLGQVSINANVLTGGKKISEGLWESEDKGAVYVLRGTDLLIGQRTRPGAGTVIGTITIKRWHNGQLGLNLPNSEEIETPTPTHVYLGDQHAPVVTDSQGRQSYNWASTSWAVDGTLTGGVPY